MTQNGPRTTPAVMQARYTLTDAGWEAARQAEAAIDAGLIEPLSEVSDA